jgi:hypothetical protein
MNPSFFLVLFSTGIVEWALFYNCPVVLSRFAVIALETRYIDVPSRAIASLAPPATVGSRAHPSLDLARLDGPAHMDLPGTELFFFARPAQFVGASTLGFFHRPRSLVRVDLSARDGRIALRATGYPAGLPPLLLGMLWASITLHSIGPLVFAILVGALFLTSDRWVSRRPIEAIAAEVSRRLHLLER